MIRSDVFWRSFKIENDRYCGWQGFAHKLASSLHSTKFSTTNYFLFLAQNLIPVSQIFRVTRNKDSISLDALVANGQVYCTVKLLYFWEQIDFPIVGTFIRIVGILSLTVGTFCPTIGTVCPTIGTE